MTKQKLYPFSMEKHAHDIELVRNRAKNRMYAMEGGEFPMDSKEYDFLEIQVKRLTELLLAVMDGSRDGRISYITGPQIGFAKEVVFMAAEIRANAIAREG